MDKKEVIWQMEFENRSGFSRELDDLLRKYHVPNSAILTVKVIKLVFGDE